MENSIVNFGDTCVCIVRVSTDQQDYQAQVSALHVEADRLGLKVLRDVQTKESGFRSIDKKEGFNQLKNILMDTGCRYVLCTELSRLARKKFVLESIKEYFVKNNIQLYIKDMNFMLFQPDGKVNIASDILFSVQASLAENEMADKKKRLSRGLTLLNQQGYSITGKLLFGYKKEQTTSKIYGKYRSKYVVDVKQAEQIKTVFNWFLNGIDGDKTRSSTRKIADESIARKMHKYLHSPTNIKHLLKNRSYTGSKVSKLKRKNAEYWVYGNDKAPRYIDCPEKTITYPVIIDIQTFEKVQLKLAGKNTRNTFVASRNEYADKSRKHVSILAKKIRCQQCGKFYIGDYRLDNKIQKYSYRCACRKAPIVSLKYTDYLIWSLCRNLYGAFSEYSKTISGLNVDEIQQRIDNILEKMESVNSQIDSLDINFLRIPTPGKAVIDAYNQSRKTLKTELSRLDSMVSTERTRKQNLLDTVYLTEETNKTIQFVESSKDGMKRYINWLVEEIHIIYKDKVNTVFKVIPAESSFLDSKCDSGESIYAFYSVGNTQRPEFRTILAKCSFDEKRKEFSFEGASPVTLKDAYNDPRFTAITYKPLDVYEEDLPDGKRIKTKTQKVDLRQKQVESLLTEKKPKNVG